jgi:hypothetical protein
MVGGGGQKPGGSAGQRPDSLVGQQVGWQMGFWWVLWGSSLVGPGPSQPEGWRLGRAAAQWVCGAGAQQACGAGGPVSLWGSSLAEWQPGGPVG